MRRAAGPGLPARPAIMRNWIGVPAKYRVKASRPEEVAAMMNAHLAVRYSPA
jgi:hypothetical protein